MKKNHKSSSFWSIATGITFLLSTILLVLYFRVFNGPLSSDSQDWANFGAYFSAICALMAFSGVLLSIEISKRQSESEKRHSIFFQMIELHNTKMLNVKYESEYGAAAFKAYTDIANQYYLNSQFAILYRKIESAQDLNMLDQLGRKLKSNFEFLQNLYQISASLGIDDITQFPIPNLLDCPKFISHKIDNIEYFIITMKQNYLLTYDDQFRALQVASDQLYENYGHILGHYFRNFFYSLLVIDNLESNNKEEIDYRKIFRAQISRYEIALNLFNAIGSFSSLQMVEFLERFNLFKDIYKKDFVFFENHNSIQSAQDAVSELLNHYKKTELELTHS